MQCYLRFKFQKDFATPRIFFLVGKSKWLYGCCGLQTSVLGRPKSHRRIVPTFGLLQKLSLLMGLWFLPLPFYILTLPRFILLLLNPKAFNHSSILTRKHSELKKRTVNKNIAVLEFLNTTDLTRAFSQASFWRASMCLSSVSCSHLHICAGSCWLICYSFSSNCKVLLNYRDNCRHSVLNTCFFRI